MSKEKTAKNSDKKRAFEIYCECAEDYRNKCSSNSLLSELRGPKEVEEFFLSLLDQMNSQEKQEALQFFNHETEIDFGI
jgi:hypothetical protein